MKKNFLYFFICFLFIPFFVYSDTVELQKKIDDTSVQIKKLEEEIASYNKEIIKVSSEANSLKNTIKVLDTTEKKLKKDLNLTETNISKTNLTLDRVSEDIEKTSKNIDLNKKALLELISGVREKEDVTFIEKFLSYNSFTDFYTELEQLNTLQKQVKIKTEDLKNLNRSLNDQKVEKETERIKLSSLKVDLSDRQKLIVQNKSEKNNLLEETKNKEAEYKKILAEKQAQKDAFEKELFDYESKLNYQIDQSKIVKARNGVLYWPLDDVYITQNFGVTNASKRLYVSGSHNGVDFRASVGTPVKASLSGVVVGTGDTDLYKGCYSFGRWVMISHGNGLSTIYAHLSVIKVTKNQEVKTGDIIGLSGNTGYSTGPHLHLGVYATEGVRIEKYVNSRACKQVVMPLADIRAYLDPLIYLPSGN